MKRLYILIIFPILLPFATVAQSVGIIPSPQHVEFQSGFYLLPQDGTPVVRERQIDTFPVDTNADQGYVLEIHSDGIVIQAISETGLFYGRQSVKQLLRHFRQEAGPAQVRVPCMRVVDYPKLKYRGWMDDISRGPIVNMEFLKRMIVTMSEYKMNFFNLYTEHVFKLPEYPDLAPTDGLTASEIKELEDFAAQYHIEFFGNQQCLAHAEKTFRIPFYQDMADTKANWNPGSEKTYDFLKYELETVAKAYTSSFFNIDCDETEALGTGKAREYVDKNGGAARVYAQHVQKMYDILKPLGKRVMMWGDIAAKDSAITAQLPEDMLMIVWSYAPSDSYVNMIEPFVKQGFEFMVAPGMSMWSTVFPSYDAYTKNIANLVRDGYRNGALGMMNTAWDDSGESLINSAWHGMCWAAEMSWNPISNFEPKAADDERERRLQTFNENFSESFNGYPVDELFAVRELEHTDIPDFFQSGSLYDDIWNFYEAKVSLTAYKQNVLVVEKLEKLREKYDSLLKSYSDTTPLQYSAMTRIGHYVCQREMVVAKMNMLRYILNKWMCGEKSISFDCGFGQVNLPIDREKLDTMVQEILQLLHQMKKEYMLLWDEENRPYGRNVVEARFDKVAQVLLNIPYQVVISSDLDETGKAVVSMHTLYDDQNIYYSTDGRVPQVGENAYREPIVLDRPTMVRAMTCNALKECVLSEKYVLLHKGLGKISKLNSHFSNYRPQYAASGKMALADGLIGGDSYADGKWQGFSGEDIDVVFDFGKKIDVHGLKARFLQNVLDWIMAPRQVELHISKDGDNFSYYQTLTLSDVSYEPGTNGIYTLQQNDLSLKTRYLRIVVKNGGFLPSWHQAKGQPSYLFCDEIVVE